MRRLGLVVLVATACSFDHLGVSGNGRVDAAIDGSIDASLPIVDAGPVDARPIDADPNLPDAAPPDATPVDAEPPDAAPPDACVPLPSELCNGIDDTCDGVVDEGLGLGNSCDGDDSDVCADDMIVCDGLGIGVVCTLGDDDVEVCNGIDDDCDGPTDEGFMLGTLCDGPDADLCNEGAFVCDAMGGSECSDTSGDSVESCNGVDDDCDGTIDEGFSLGTMCDGADTDLCVEGVIVCDGMGGAVCGDTTSSTVETCNSLDDDCDGVIDNGFDLATDESNCGACGTVCQLTNASSNTCTSSVCVPVCAAGAQNCDGNGANGCEVRDTNPPCSATVTDLGSVSGDNTAAMDTITTSGFSEVYLKARVTENVVGGVPITVRVDLASPTGVNFDLRVYCASCTGASQTSTNGAGMTDTVFLGRDDLVGDRSYDIFIEIFFGSATACGNWTLTIDGAVTTSNRTCN